MNKVTYQQEGEEKTSPELMKVRNLLIYLPRVNCPAGFEYRLQRRLNELGHNVRPTRERFGWGMGWAGLGLGFTAALVIAVVAFDFSFTSPHVVGAGPVATSTVELQNSPTQASAPNIAKEPVYSQTDQQPVSNIESDQQMLAAKKDSNTAKNPPTNLPDNLYHMVGGNSP